MDQQPVQSRVDRVGTMCLEFNVKNVWSSFSLRWKDGVLRRIETRTLTLQPHDNAKLELDNGDLIDWHTLELVTSSEYASPKDIFAELHENDLGHLLYSRDNEEKLYLSGYVVWCPEIDPHRFTDTSITIIRLKTSNVPFLLDHDDQYVWKPGADHVIRISGIEFFTTHRQPRRESDG